MLIFASTICLYTLTSCFAPKCRVILYDAYHVIVFLVGTALRRAALRRHGDKLAHIYKVQLYSAQKLSHPRPWSVVSRAMPLLLALSHHLLSSAAAL